MSIHNGANNASFCANPSPKLPNLKFLVQLSRPALVPMLSMALTSNL